MMDYKDLPAVNGWDIRAVVSYDDIGIDPAEEYDCYSADQIEAWKQDEWSFVTVTVEVSRRGHVLGIASLGGLERGWFPTDAAEQFLDPLEYLADDGLEDLVEEAIANANEELDRLL